MASHAIKAGEGDAFVSAGVECVSRYRGFGSAGVDPADTHNPLFAAAEQRTLAYAETNEPWHDPRLDGELPDIYISMGQTAENVATAARHLAGPSRTSSASGPRTAARRRSPTGCSRPRSRRSPCPTARWSTTDDGPRPGTTLEAVSALKPVFRADGTVTAGNCCPLNDGAAAVVIMSDRRAAELGLTPLARIVATGVSALSPEIMGAGPGRGQPPAPWPGPG